MFCPVKRYSGVQLESRWNTYLTRYEYRLPDGKWVSRQRVYQLRKDGLLPLGRHWVPQEDWDGCKECRQLADLQEQ